MIDTICLFISIIIGIIGLIIAFWGYKKDKETYNSKAVSRLSIRILVLTMVVIALNSIVVPVINHLRPKEPLATKRDFERLAQIFREKPRNPSIEEVENELEREIKAALEKQKEKAIGEYQRGIEAYNNNYFELAITHFSNALKMIRIASFHFALGNSYYFISQYDAAKSNYDSSLGLYIESANKQGEAGALGNIGLIYSDKGDLDNALKYHQQALVINKDIGYKQGEAGNLGNIGVIYRIKGDLDNALKYHQQALVISKDIGYKQGEAGNLDNIGLIYSDKGDLDNALKYHQQAKEIFKKIGSKRVLQSVQQAVDDLASRDKSNQKAMP